MKENRFSGNHENVGHKKGELTIDQCIIRADRYITANGMCLFLMDVVGSMQRVQEQRVILRQQLLTAKRNMNEFFAEYFPTNNLATQAREETGFEIGLGDGMWAGINNIVVIPLVIDHMNKNFPDIKFHYGVARDGYDRRGIALLR